MAYKHLGPTGSIGTSGGPSWDPLDVATQYQTDVIDPMNKARFDAAAIITKNRGRKAMISSSKWWDTAVSKAKGLFSKGSGQGSYRPTDKEARANYRFQMGMDALAGGSPLGHVSGGDRSPYRRGMAPGVGGGTQAPLRRGGGGATRQAPSTPATPSKKITAPKKGGKGKTVTARKKSRKVTGTKAKPAGKSWWGRQDADTKNLIRVGAGALGGLLLGGLAGRGGDETEYDIEYHAPVINRYYGRGRY